MVRLLIGKIIYFGLLHLINKDLLFQSLYKIKDVFNWLRFVRNMGVSKGLIIIESRQVKTFLIYLRILSFMEGAIKSV